MILPIMAYGSPVLKQKADFIEKDYPGLNALIDNMFETMYHAPGVGLAAPQVGVSIRLFVIDAAGYSEDEPELKDFRRVFINAEIVESTGNPYKFNEGCLSIPHIREDIDRPPHIRLKYVDEHFNPYEEEFSGIAARIIQHEYDHIDGILFTDRISPFRKTLLKSKLNNISRGNITVNYRMKFPHFAKR